MSYTMVRVFTILAVLAVSLTILKAERRSFIGCVDSEECGAGRCCVLGLMRYSSPTCQPLLGAGDHCRPNNDPENFTLSYPNGYAINVTNIYQAFCACKPYLTCDKETYTCR